MTAAHSGEAFRARQDPIEIMAAIKLRNLLASRQQLVFPYAARPLVSIVIPVYDRAHYLYLTLETLLGTPGRAPFEVILVDDGATDAVRHLLARLGNVRVHAHLHLGGFGEACNRGAALARGAFVCFLSSDAMPTPGWLDVMLDTMGRHPTCGAVGAKLLSAGGTLQEAGGILWRDGTARGYGHGENPAALRYSVAREVDYCSAACLLVRREAFDAVGGFDPRYRMGYYQDVDLCLGMRRAGYRVWYAPHPIIINHEYPGGEHARANALHVHSRALLLEKWSDLSRDHGPPGMERD